MNDHVRYIRVTFTGGAEDPHHYNEASRAAEYDKALTGNDDDVLLAAEKAIRERLGGDYVELWPEPNEDSVAL